MHESFDEHFIRGGASAPLYQTVDSAASVLQGGVALVLGPLFIASVLQGGVALVLGPLFIVGASVCGAGVKETEPLRITGPV